MVRWREGRHLMPVPRVLEIEVLHFLRNLCISTQSPHTLNDETETDDAHLERREHVPPVREQPREHAVRAAFVYFAEAAEDGELVVVHAHVSLSLCFVRVR